jgi:hypothetical protein
LNEKYGENQSDFDGGLAAGGERMLHGMGLCSISDGRGVGS